MVSGIQGGSAWIRACLIRALVFSTVLAMPAVSVAGKIPQWKWYCLVKPDNCIFSVSGTITSKTRNTKKKDVTNPDGSRDISSTNDNQVVTITVSGILDQENQEKHTVNAEWLVTDSYNDQTTSVPPPLHGLCPDGKTRYQKKCPHVISNTKEVTKGKGSFNDDVTINLPFGPFYVKYKKRGYHLSAINGMTRHGIGLDITHDDFTQCQGTLCPGEKPAKIPDSEKTSSILLPSFLLTGDGEVDAKNPFHLTGPVKGCAKPVTYPQDLSPGETGSFVSEICWDLTVTVAVKPPSDPLPPSLTPGRKPGK